MENSTFNFKESDKVYYIPNHAKGNVTHKDVEIGVVTSVNKLYVFVQFSYGTTSKACLSENLRKY